MASEVLSSRLKMNAHAHEKSLPLPVLGRALVVDDDEGIRRSAGALLRRKGFTVKVATNGFEAVDLLVGMSFDLVMTDLDMPGMDGFELFGWIRERCLPVPVVIMSGRLPDDRPSLALLRCASAILLKPFGATEFASALREVSAHLPSVQRLNGTSPAFG